MKRIFGIIFLVLVLAGIFVYAEKINHLVFKLPELQDQLQDVSKPEVISPPPLRSFKSEPAANLIGSGIVFWTNQYRTENGLPELNENVELNAAALTKAKDMLNRQYFAHVSPTGEDASDLSKAQGYEFVLIGENLASGNFAGDADLVQAWMESPGHRENILNTRYQDIGAGVVRGQFEGQTAWLAVQIFGLPLSACPQPNQALKVQIEANEETLDQLQATLDLIRQEIENTSPKRGPAYNQKVEEYNVLAKEYNDLIRQTQALINQYNGQVSAFNQCVVVK
ncbi:MAG: CAP domain-containing protein [Candidatus Doudnabacteria bacterium]|nr:CAP domain-containing protein [Candidatus Doudnabacteria bacterium]